MLTSRILVAVAFVACLGASGCAAPTAPLPSSTPTPAVVVMASPLTPDSSLLGDVDVAIAHSDWPQSIRLLEQLLNRDPTSAIYKVRLYEAHLALGRSELGHNLPDAARREFVIAQSIDPTRADATAALASLLVTSTPTALPTAVWPITSTPTRVPTVSAKLLYVWNTGGDGVYLRKTPGGRKLTTWSDGTAMRPSGESSELGRSVWLKVTAPDASVGWISSIFLTASVETPTAVVVPPPAQIAWPAVVAPRPAVLFTREQFSALVKGASPEQVIAAVGRPDETDEVSGGMFWYFDGRTYDPASGHVDSVAQVIFSGRPTLFYGSYVNFTY